jgi:putative transposase
MVYNPPHFRNQNKEDFQMSNSIVSIPDFRSLIKEVAEEPEKVFDLLKIDMRRSFERAVSELIKAELTSFLGRERYERYPAKKVEAEGEDGKAGDLTNYRNGYYSRTYTVKNVGTLKVQISRDRLGKFNSRLINKYERYDRSLEKDLGLIFLSGLSTRGISLISKSLLGRKISASEVSRVNAELLTGIEGWRLRPLHEEKIKYIYVDGVNFSMRVKSDGKRSIERIPMLVSIGVNERGRRMFLGIQQGDKDSASTWREIFKDLKSRGLDHTLVKLGIMDGLPGLEKVFREEFPQAKVQRCQVHAARNVLTKTPKKMKHEVADRLRDIFYASNKENAVKYYEVFVDKYEAGIPSAVQSLKNSIESCLTFFSFPEEDWRSLRTTNAIERVNKEFKRRTGPMEILAGEKSAYRLLCFIALKMELHWRSAPFGKENLPALENFKKFTQNT